MDYITVLIDPVVQVALLMAIFNKYLGKLGPIFVNCAKRSSKKLATLIRVKKWKAKRAFYSKAINPHKVTWNIVRTYFYLTIFVMSMFFYIIFYILGSLGNIANMPFMIQHFVFSPIYVLEALWLVQHFHTEELIRATSRKRLTSGLWHGRPLRSTTKRYSSST